MKIGNSVNEPTLRFQSYQDFFGIKRVSESSPSTEFTYPSHTYPKTIQGDEEKSEVRIQDTQYANLVEPYFWEGYNYQPTGEQLQQLSQVYQPTGEQLQQLTQVYQPTGEQLQQLTQVLVFCLILG